MAVETTINPDEKLLTARFTGKVTLEDCRNALVDAMTNTVFDPTYDQLVDLVEAQYIPSIADMAKAGKLVMIMRNSLKGKIAVITTSRTTMLMAKALKQLAEKEGVVLDAFLPADAAKVWLRRK